MSQTELSYADLVAGLPDNVAQEISPSDVRNAFATALGGYASLIQGISPTSMLAVLSARVVDVFDNIVAKSIDVNSAGSDASLSTNALTVGEDGIYFVNFFASFQTGNNNRTVLFQPFVNGFNTNLKILQRFGAVDVQTTSFFGTFPLNKDDEIDIRVSIFAGGSTDLIYQSAGFSIFRVG
jgi:hypothetical protein